MPTHSRTHSDATQIIEEILKETAKPRQSASVRDALEKKNPAPVTPETLGGNNGGKPEPLKPEYQGKFEPHAEREWDEVYPQLTRLKPCHQGINFQVYVFLAAPGNAPTLDWFHNLPLRARVSPSP